MPLETHGRFNEMHRRNAPQQRIFRWKINQSKGRSYLWRSDAATNLQRLGPVDVDQIFSGCKLNKDIYFFNQVSAEVVDAKD